MSPPAISTSALLFTIADISRETGLQKDTLRVWERRYGFPQPGRDLQGERVYDADQLHKLRLIKRLLDAGCRPGSVVTLSVADLEAQLQAPPLKRAPSSRAAHAASTPQPWTLWLHWVQQGNVDAVQQALSQHALKHGLMHTMDELLGPLGHAIGEAWMRGDITVYQEHLYTEAVHRFLQARLQDAHQHPPHANGPKVLLSTLPGDPHSLGLLMVECMLTLEGCTCRSLGRDTPLADMVAAMHSWHMDALALSISPLPAAAQVRSDLQQLRQTLREPTPIWVGGASPHVHRKGLPHGVDVMRRVADLSASIAQWRNLPTTDVP